VDSRILDDRTQNQACGIGLVVFAAVIAANFTAQWRQTESSHLRSDQLRQNGPGKRQDKNPALREEPGE
jgi:hypothetical protein